MEPVQTPATFFFAPVTVAYALACSLYFLSHRSLWPPQEPPVSTRKWLDLALSFAACAAVLLVGQLYSNGLLIPGADNRRLNALAWIANNALIYSPIFFVLALRKQGLDTVYLSSRNLLPKIAFGLAASLAGIVMFVALRGEWSSLPDIARSAFSLKSFQNFPAVFFEGVALAFLFVRLRWRTGLLFAIGVPSLLFAFAHVPGMVTEGRSFFHILSFSAVTGSITALALFTLERSKDIVWLGLVHYFIDVAIKAF